MRARSPQGIWVHVCAFLWYKPWVHFWLMSLDHSQCSGWHDHAVIKKHELGFFRAWLNQKWWFGSGGTWSVQVAGGHWKHRSRQQRAWNKFSWYTYCMPIEASSAAVLSFRSTLTGLCYTQIQPSHVPIETKPSSEHDSCQKHWWSLQEDPKLLSPWPFDKYQTQNNESFIYSSKAVLFWLHLIM